MPRRNISKALPCETYKLLNEPCALYATLCVENNIQDKNVWLHVYKMNLKVLQENDHSRASGQGQE
jgi:hypothetical protein